MKSEQDNVKYFFDGYAEDFDSIYGHSKGRSILDKIFDNLFRQSMYSRYNESLLNTKHENIKTILDVGCGGGHYTEAFLKQGKTVVGIDIANKMLEVAKLKTANFIKEGKVNYIHSGYLQHEFNVKFDAAVLTGFFDYIKVPEEIFEKLKKDVTKEIYMSFPKKGGILAYQRKVRYGWRNCPLYLYKKSDLVKIFENVGWKDNVYIKDLGRDYFVKVTLK